jgi:uncharacterized protein (DUF486 family)
MKGWLTIGMLVLSNVFMTLAWYGHIKFAQWSWFAKIGLFGLVMVSWGIAFFEYCLQVPANRMGSIEHGGPFSIWQLKAIQEIITLVVFVIFALVFFKNDTFRWNHAVGFVLLALAAYFIFKK